ncbi:MAG: GNAT family N-acetyltransferase [Bacteroidales bacterium]|nr:GNAT family N-acetyltransferase [Bacteroidales bacterium]
MLSLKSIKSFQEPYSSLLTLYGSAFPEEERRANSNLLMLIENEPAYSFQAILDDEVLLGFISIWKFPDFWFIEHFAVLDELRNQGYGSTTIDYLKNTTGFPIVLETEKEISGLAVARIKFYERLGFHKAPFEYSQPPYQKGMPFIPMYLFSSGSPLNHTDFIRIRKILYEKVYGISV